jgi:hypothetical protein
MNRSTAKDLRSHGVTKEDIKALKILEHILIDLDLTVFGDKRIRRLNFCTKPKIRKIAMYCHGGTSANYYSIAVVGLAKEIQNMMLGRCIFVSKGRRWKTKRTSATTVSIENVCLRIAAHEVRHRMQFEGKVAQFSKSYAIKAQKKWAAKKVNRKSLFARVLNFCRHYFDIKTEDLQKAKRTKKFIAKETSRIEFDAVFIEYFVANMTYLYPTLSIKDVADIVKMRPLEIS